ncbi:MAG: hypothetical protein LBM75_09730 [Myxococcales bacterium]|jgi:ElaB/YqjD/DUF883 family membrane-anchored ribosome-binding protein|nr:hypothetical protein [Myxococcales bacterium]
MDSEAKRNGKCGTAIPSDMEERFEAIEERVQAGIELARTQLATLNERTTDLMRAHPGATILVAIGAGYLVGRLASRKWR